MNISPRTTPKKDRTTWELQTAINHCLSLTLHRQLARRCELSLDIDCGNGDSARVISRVSNRVIALSCSGDSFQTTVPLPGPKFEIIDSTFHNYRGKPASFDLIAWNIPPQHSYSKNQWVHMSNKITRLLKPEGSVVLTLVRPLVFDSNREAIDTFAGWSPLQIMRMLRDSFVLHTWDVKSTLIEEYRLEEIVTCPPFEIIFGKRRNLIGENN